MCRHSGRVEKIRGLTAVVTGREVAPVPRGIDRNGLAALRCNPLGSRYRVGVLDGRRHAAFWYGGS